ncbi:hypothetical protein AURDEDRAFT_164113 [Auricularia subglabra TFB-10046 SS5]|nr:hypothetical protein AURDEDRAFT_164113 [Auricularia subglabra TFB-10046 SS5]
MEIPAYVPRTHYCNDCQEHHDVVIGNEHDAPRFREKIVVKCRGHYIAKWLSNHRVLVPLVPPVPVPVYRPTYVRRNTLVALLDPPAVRHPPPPPRVPEGRPNPRRVTISLEMQNHHVTFRTADVLRNEFKPSLLDADALRALHYHDILLDSLQIREGQTYTYLGQRSMPLAPQTSHVSLRAKSRRFPFRFARDMADAFATFETHCRLHPDTSPVDAFRYAFPDLDWPGENAFFDAQLQWDTITPGLRRDCANDRYTDDFLWDRVRGAAEEHNRLSSLRRPPEQTTVKQERGPGVLPLKRSRSSPQLPPAGKRGRRDSGAAPRGGNKETIVIVDDDDIPVIEIDD